MPLYTFRHTQVVALPLDTCWSFFSNPANLSRITPPGLGFRIRSELPREIYPGLLIRYTVSPVLRIPLTWVTEITHMRKPHFFVDEQRVGPYRIWHHEHSFRGISSEDTEVTDVVHYVPPFGPIGAVLNALVIAPRVKAIFDFRADQLAQIAPSGGRDSFA
ncbi:MAG: SRPBCC family protein [Chthoniobacterales bacterium]|nr:SRPBCC family protein [Chthoniobacterales bacterium]